MSDYESSSVLPKLVPRWIAIVYGILAAITLPWTMYLAIKLPVRHLSAHWDLAWVGFDIGLFFILLMTAVLAYAKSKLLIIAATATATMLVVDAWFDILTAHAGKQLNESLTLAVIAELPLALLSFYVAYKIVTNESKSLT